MIVLAEFLERFNEHMKTKRINSDKPHLWKADVAASVDQFNNWFLQFAPEAFRSTRIKTTQHVKDALIATFDLMKLDPETLRVHPSALSTLRMCTAPPLAVDRLIGLAKVSKNLVGKMETGKIPPRMNGDNVSSELAAICYILSKLLDRDIFPWLAGNKTPNELERDRASTIVADRLCSAVANPIVRNAQEQRQLAIIGNFLNARGYTKQQHPSDKSLKAMKPGTYAFRMNLSVGNELKVNIPIDIVIQPTKPRSNKLPILIEAKSAGDFTNTNKRRKEEAFKIHQLQATFGADVPFILFLCGYFGTDYLGYEAAEGIDWVWEHRIDDLLLFGV